MPDQQSHPRPEASGVDVSRSMFLTRNEAARYLNLTPSWLANNTRCGPRFIKVGGLVRYSVEALDDFMSKNEGRR